MSIVKTVSIPKNRGYFLPFVPGYDDDEAGEMAIHYLCRGERFTSEGAANWGRGRSDVCVQQECSTGF